MINQLTLGVSLKDEATFTNFYTGKNTQLVTALQNAAKGTGEHVIYFYGLSGCTHLLQAACHLAPQHNQSAVYVPLAELSDFSPDIFEGLESLHLILIDDIHRIAGKPQWEEAFFHMYNRIHAKGGRIV